jgi:hypothetical protein
MNCVNIYASVHGNFGKRRKSRGWTELSWIGNGNRSDRAEARLRDFISSNPKLCRFMLRSLLGNEKQPNSFLISSFSRIAVSK